MDIDLKGHELALKALVGSHNYNLSTPASDRDYKYFVWPTFDELLAGEKYHESVVSEEKDYTVHDIRMLPAFLKKANLNFLEILYSQEVEGDTELVYYLGEHKDELALSNKPALYASCMGTAEQEKKQMQKDSPGRHESIEKFGYDAKSAHHAMRIYGFVKALANNGFDFEKALWHNAGSFSKRNLINIKRGKFSLTAIQKVLEDGELGAKGCEASYKEEPYNSAPYEALEQKINEMVKERLTQGKGQGADVGEQE